MAHATRIVCALSGTARASRGRGTGFPLLLRPQWSLIPNRSPRSAGKAVAAAAAAVAASVTAAATRLTPTLAGVTPEPTIAACISPSWSPSAQTGARRHGIHDGQHFHPNGGNHRDHSHRHARKQQQQQPYQQHGSVGITCGAAACKQHKRSLTTLPTARLILGQEPAISPLKDSHPLSALQRQPRAALSRASRPTGPAGTPASGGSASAGDGRKNRVNALKVELARLSPAEAVKHVIEAAHFGRKVLRVHWHVALEACGRVGFYKPAERVLEAMLEHGVKPNAYTYRVVIHCYGMARQLEGVMRAYEELRAIQCQKEKGRLTAKDYNTLLEAISRCGALAEFEQVYAQMKQDGVQPDDKTLVSAMTCYSNVGREEELNDAFEQYVAKQKAGYKPMSPYVFNAYMTHYSRAGNTAKCRDILHMWRVNNEDTNWYLINGYMAAHAVNGESDTCRAIFESEFVGEGEAQITPSVLNTLMHSYVRAGRTEDARGVLALFDEFRLKPQATTFMLLLQAVADKGNVAAVRALMKRMEQAQITVGARAHAMLFRAMYLRGDPPQALETEFDAMMQRNAKPLPLAFESLYLAYARMKDSAGCETTLRRMRLLDVSFTPAMQAAMGVAEGTATAGTATSDDA